MTNNETKLLSIIDVNRDSDNVRQEPRVKLKDALPQIAASCAINFIVIQAGINMTFSSILIPQLVEDKDEFIKLNLDSSTNLASIVTVSTALGALVCGSLMDRFGRIQLAKMVNINYSLLLILYLSLLSNEAFNLSNFTISTSTQFICEL
jgi:MFS family permease